MSERRAVIVATGLEPALDPLNQRIPSPMLPLLDRPFIQHVVELLTSRGYTAFDVVLNHFPEQIEHLLGNGERWGVHINCHLARDHARPYAPLGALDTGDAEGPVLLCQGDTIPLVPWDALDAPGTPCLLCEGADAAWTGWAFIAPQALRDLPASETADVVQRYLRAAADAGGTIQAVEHCLRADSFEHLLHAQATLLAHPFPGLLSYARESDPGVWLARNVQIRPSARIQPPVYLCENTRIGAGASLGPNAVVGRDCIIDDGTEVENALVMPGSYVGESLELRDAIVDRNCLVNAREGAAVTVSDSFILGNLAQRSGRALMRGLLSRAAALLLLVLFSPLLLAAWLVRRAAGPALRQRRVVRLPAGPTDPTWPEYALLALAPDPAPSVDADGLTWRAACAHFLLRFLPGLWNVVRGDLALVGLAPRTREEVAALSADWRALYLAAKGGLVTEDFLLHGEHADPDLRYTAEAFYSVSASLGYDLRLLLRYARALLPGPRP